MQHIRFLAMAFALTQIGSAATANTLECLRANISVQPVEFDQSTIDSRVVRVEVKNSMDIALGGVWIEFEIHSDQRGAAIYTGSIRPAATIEGLLEPGETMVATDYHFMDDRALQFARDANALTLELSVKNAADSQMNGFIEHPRMASWSGETTEQHCISP
tara:strand:+ start:3645 stop:4127 length:483 start_codon:yes stop_codon:yes gene_type:complete